MREQVLEILQKQKEAMSLENLMHEIETINGESLSVDDIKELQAVLSQLERNSDIHVTKKGKYELVANSDRYIVGKIDVTEKGAGFLLVEEPGKKDIHIDKSLMNGALDNDKVLVEILSDNPMKPEGKVVRIVERDNKNIVGEVKVINAKKVFVTNNKKFKNNNILIDQSELNKCVEGEILAVSIDDELSKQNNFVAHIKEKIGHKDDPDMDILSLAAEYNVFMKVPDEAMEQAKSMPTEVLPEEKVGRTDLTNKMIFTIDDKTTKDIDDAISLDILDNGNYLLGVHIADVSHYVTENSPLDKDAFDRGTSNYLGDSVIPQLPHILSNGICSLNEQVERLTITCEMEINQQGRVIDADVFPSIIKSNKKMNYADCNAILEGTIAEGYEPFVETLLKMVDLHKLIRKERYGRGASDFDTTEVKHVFNENRHVIDVIPRTRGEFERVIEDFMIVANESVARKFQFFNGWVRGLPSIYRVHAAPDPKRVQEFITFLSQSGQHIVGKFNTIENPKKFQKLLEQIEANDAEKDVINQLAIRTMSKAEYSKDNIGHFGLASESYTHFTSPIRRYPDLMIHRLLWTYYFEGMTDERTIQYYDSILDEIARHSSLREKNADELERKVDDMLNADYMTNHIGDEYDAIVSGVQPIGLYVKLPNGVQGLVKIENLASDTYVFDEETRTIIGQKTKTIYRLGSFIHVKCISASKELGKIDFEQVKQNTLEQKVEKTR